MSQAELVDHALALHLAAAERRQAGASQRKEVEAWRRLHRAHPEQAWACACGTVMPPNVTRCDDCEREKPTRERALAGAAGRRRPIRIAPTGEDV